MVTRALDMIRSNEQEKIDHHIKKLENLVAFLELNKGTYIQDHYRKRASFVSSSIYKFLTHVIDERKDFIESISPEDAYLVGLLHGIGAIPKVMGWSNGGPDARDPGALFEIEGLLPLFVLAALRSVNDPRPSSIWRFVLTTAHELAGAKPDFHEPSYYETNPLALGAARRTRSLPGYDEPLPMAAGR